MSPVLTDYKKELIDEIKGLPEEKTKEVREFVCFLKYRDVLSKIDSTQAYFWTPKWQEMEKEAEEDIKAGRVYGPFDSVDEMMKDLEK